MSQKYCPDCKKIILSSATVNFCCWCGKWLDIDVPKYVTFEEREKILSELKNNNRCESVIEFAANIQPAQMKLF